MLNLFKHCFDYRIQSHFQHFNIIENCILCFCYHYLLDYHVQNTYENNILQVFSHYKHLVSFLNFYKLLMKQVLKILYHLVEVFLFFVVFYCVHESCCVCIKWHVFSAILTFAAHSFSFCCHNLLLWEQKCVFL